MILRKRGTVIGMQEQFENTQNDLIHLNDLALQERLERNLQREVRTAGKLHSGKNNDQLSVSILRCVSSLYGRKQYALMSPAEIADELKLKCQKRNPKRIKSLPTIWIWCSIFLFLCMLLLSFIFTKMELAYHFVQRLLFCSKPEHGFFRRILALEKLAQIVALSGISYGTSFSVQSEELSIRKWSSANADKFERGLRALHTLMSQTQELTAGKERLCQLNEQSEQLRQSNLQSLKQLRSTSIENAMEQEEVNRKIQKHLSENTRLEEEKKQRLETISNATRQIQYNKTLENELKNSCLRPLVACGRTDIPLFNFIRNFSSI